MKNYFILPVLFFVSKSLLAQPDWSPITQQLKASQYDHFSLVIGNKDRVLYSFSKGNVAPDSNMIIWSASKWVTSTVILKLVDQGKMKLNDNPQKYISWWQAGVNPDRLLISLAQLLNFTAGFKDEKRLVGRCSFNGRVDYLECAKRIYKNNAFNGDGRDEGGLEHRPGSFYSYGGKPMHIAGLMAMQATKVNDWNLVFDDFRKNTGLFPGKNSYFRTPSVRNPMPQGGLHTSALEYAEFLRGHLNGALLSAESSSAMYRDHTPVESVGIDYSPIRDSYMEAEGVSEDWHYGLGLWLECPKSKWESSCGVDTIFSSPGAKGFYPWIDFKNGYYGILATQEHNPPRTAIKTVRPLRSLIEKLVKESH